MATWKHSRNCPNPCKKCKEHCRYLRHKAAEHWEWFTIPIASCASKCEAKRVEKWAIKRWHPNLNKCDKPFWKLSENYTRDVESRSRCQITAREWKEREIARITAQGDNGIIVPRRLMYPALATYKY